MKIALLGYGKMGRIVETVAARHGIEIVMHFTRTRPCRSDEETRKALAETTLVDFSVPEAVLENIRVAAALSLDLVVGTTGWHHQLEAAREIVAGSDIGVVYGSNFSVGVNLFYQIVERAAQLFAAFDGYDPFIQELHHRFKKDAPSGTALVLQKLLAHSYEDRRISVTSVRAGQIPGTHAVSFDS